MIARLSSYLNQFCFKRISRRRYLLEDLLKMQREEILAEMNRYPSFINTGYLHFERLFEIAREENLTKEKGLILDIGGADGITAIRLSEQFPDCRVYVFEPLAENAPSLRQNIADHSRIQFFPVALGSEKRSMDIHITKRITSSSLLPVDAKSLGNDYLSSQLAPQKTERIQVERLDDLVEAGEKILVMKLDVQGFELEVLRGGLNTLKNTRLVMCEMQNHQLYQGAPLYYDIDEFLRKQNFTLLQIVPSLRKRQQMLEWDAIYINRSYSNY